MIAIQVICSNLEILNLEYTCNFAEIESLHKITDIVKDKPHLKQLNIKTFGSDRKVKVEVKYATEDEVGSIEVKSSKEGVSELFSVETVKKEDD